MMMKVKFSAKRTVTTADLYIANDPPLVFEIRVRPPRVWARLYEEFEKDGSRDEDLALQLVSLVFLNVTDGENGVHEIDTIDKAEGLQAAIEEGNPGFGKEFICDLAWGFGRHHYSFLGNHSAGSLEPLEPSNVNGELISQASGS